MPYKLSKIEAPMRLSLAFNEAFNAHDVDAMVTLLMPTCVIEHYAPAPDGTTLTGTAEVKAFWQGFFDSSPQARRKIIDASGLGRTCIVHWRLDAGEASYLRGIDVIEVKDQLIAKIQSYVKGA